jgi:hypothetical protein
VSHTMPEVGTVTKHGFKHHSLSGFYQGESR